MAGVRKGRIGNLGALEGREEGVSFPTPRALFALFARNPLAFQTPAKEASYAVRCTWC